MEMVDRFLSAASPGHDPRFYLASRSRYQLLAMGALYVAIKVTEPVALGSDLFAEASGGLYAKEDFEDAELELLRVLEYRVHARPTARAQARIILSSLAPLASLKESTWNFLLDEVSFFAEYSVRDDYFSGLPPSAVALAAIFNVLDYVDRDECREVVRALRPAMRRFHFASPRVIFEAKGRLGRLVEADDGPAAMDDWEEDGDCMSAEEDESSGMLGDCSFSGHDDPASNNTSPRAVLCYR